LARDAHNLAPEDGRISDILAWLVYESGDYKWAFSLAQDAARKLPDEVDVLYHLAWASYRMGRVDEAITAMRKVLEKNSPIPKAEDAQLFCKLVEATLSHPESLPSLAELQGLVKNKPDYLPGLMALAAVCERDGSVNEAKDLYQKIAAANPLF